MSYIKAIQIMHEILHERGEERENKSSNYESTNQVVLLSLLWEIISNYDVTRVIKI